MVKQQKCLVQWKEDVETEQKCLSWQKLEPRKSGENRRAHPSGSAWEVPTSRLEQAIPKVEKYVDRRTFDLVLLFFKGNGCVCVCVCVCISGK